ncbi:MAG TPA: MATE family efflux transporter [Clostridia bacterium]|nr:MATE family efflux transporter [Clostridia bacterium]
MSSNVINKNLWVLTGPIFIELILSISLLITDTFFLSMVSDNAASSVGATLAVISVCMFLFEALAQGGGSVVAQFLGAKREDDAAAAFSASLFLNLVAGFLISAFFVLFHRNIAGWLGFSSKSLEYASVYMGIIGSTIIIQAAKFFYSSVISSIGKTYWNMIITVIANIINISINYFFITGAFGIPKPGVKGVAYATVISYVAAVIIAMIVVHVRLKICFAFRRFLDGFKTYSRSILSIAVPSALEPVSYHLSQMIIAIMIIKLGDIALGARTYAFNLSYINYVWYYAIAIGTQILVAHLVGAKLFDRVNKLLLKSLIQGAGGSLVITGLIFIFSRFLLSLYTKNEEILKLGTIVLGLGIAFGVLSTVNTIITMALRAAGDAKYTSFMGIIVMWVIGIPLCYYLGIYLNMGMVGVLLGMIIDELIRGVLNYRRWLQRKWEHTGVVVENEPENALKS